MTGEVSSRSNPKPFLLLSDTTLLVLLSLLSVKVVEVTSGRIVSWVGAEVLFGWEESEIWWFARTCLAFRNTLLSIVLRELSADSASEG